MAQADPDNGVGECIASRKDQHHNVEEKDPFKHLGLFIHLVLKDEALECTAFRMDQHHKERSTKLC